jgi:curved DNA-binding protein
MADKPFVDYYEILQVGQNADLETVERVFRLLAKRYHPDNSESGDDERFREVHDAFEVLADPQLRAEYDVQYDRNKTLQWSIFEQGSAIGGQEEDRRIFRGVLALLYAARRKNPRSGGLGAVDLERMLGVPREHLEFPNWYLKKKGWVEVLDSGQFAITVEGIDKISSDELSVPDNRLLSEPAEETLPDGTEETREETADGFSGETLEE